MAINVNQGVQNATTVKTDKVDQSIQKQQVAQQQVNMSAPAQKQDSVSLTTQAQQFTKAQEKASNSSGIDQEKVDKIKQAIAEGRYKINVEALARRIMQFEGELFDKKMIEPALILPLFEKQQEHLMVLLALLKSELAAIASRNVEELDKCCAVKLECLEQIQQLDAQIAAIPNLTELKTQPWFVEKLQAIDDVLQQCKEQNEINSLTLQQSQLIVERFKHELLQNRGKSGLTYTAKGKPAVDNKGSGIKA